MTRKIDLPIDHFEKAVDQAHILSIVDAWQKYRQELASLMSMSKPNPLSEERQKRFDLLVERIPMLETAYENKIIEIVKNHERTNK